MGSSKSNTGIGFIDNAVDATINQGTNALAKNVERNVTKITQGVGLAFQGKWDGVGRTLGDIATGMATGGLSLLANPDDIDRGTGTQSAVDRHVDKLENEAKDNEAIAAAADIKTKADENTRMATGVVSGLTEARRRTPGVRAQTLLNSGQQAGSNTLLNIMGKK